MPTVPWMQAGPFGLMVHWLSHTLPRSGRPIRDWDDKVAAFDLDRFWSDVRRTGARWLIFTLGQNTGLYCAPNAFLDREYPGLCSRRDLFGEIAARARADGIRLIAYLPSEADVQPAETRRFWEWDAHPRDKSRFQEKYMNFIRAYAERYGLLLDGWFFDGCYDAIEKSFMRTRTWHNGRFDFPAWQAAARAGNPAAVITMLRGANDPGYVFREQDYLAGEFNDLKAPLVCESATVDGMQWHALLWLDCFWMHTDKVGEIVPPRFGFDDLQAYTRSVHTKGGALTFNVGIYENGALADASVDLLAKIAQGRAEVKTEEGPV